MNKDRFYLRVFEIIPGLMTWGTLGTLFVLAFIKPLWVAIFVITFDLYWVIRVIYLTSLLIFAYRRLEKEKSIDWLKEVRSLDTTYGVAFKDVYNAVLFPAYKEGLDILIPSISALETANYPKDRMIVVVSVEERAGQEVWDNAQVLKERYKDTFFQFLITRHPDGEAGRGEADKGERSRIRRKDLVAQEVQRRRS